MIKFICDFVKKNKIIILIYNVSFIIGYFLDSYSFGYMFYLLESKKMTFHLFILCVGVIYLSIIIFKGISDILNQKLESTAFKFRMKLVNKFLNNTFMNRYNSFEDSKFINIFNKGVVFFSGDNVGYQLIITNIVNLLPMIILSIIAIFVIGKTSILIVAVTIALTIFTFPLYKKIDDFDVENDLDEGDILKNIEYYQSITTDNSYGKDIRVFNFRPLIINKYDSLVKEALNIIIRKSKLSIFLGVIFTSLELINDISVILILYYLFDIRTLSTYMIVFGMHILLKENVKNIVKTVSAFIKNIKLFENYEDTMASNIQDIECKKDIEKGFNIELKNVGFKYPKNDKYVLKGINLVFNSNEKIGIIGENGAGKTTLIKIIIGLFEQTEGDILINGKATSVDERLNYFSAIFQSSQLFMGNIRDNLFYGNRVTNAEEDIINDYFKKHDIKKDGKYINLNTKIGLDFYEDAFKPSGGQEKLIVILRALLNENKMLILDEPTSSLDPENEEKFYTRLTEDSIDRGYIIISHRLAISNLVDKIIVIKDSCIDAIGNHSEVKRKSKYYMKLNEMLVEMYSDGGDEV